MAWIKKPEKKSGNNKSGRNIDAARIYNSSQWRRLRAYYLMSHPLCEDCLEKGISVPTQEIHHIKPILTGSDLPEMEDLAYSENNLRALCIECHKRTHTELHRNGKK